MDEFEQIFNSIYAEQHPDADDINDTKKVKPSNNSLNQEDVFNNQEGIPNNIYAAYDRHHPPVIGKYYVDPSMKEPIDPVKDKESEPSSYDNNNEESTAVNSEITDDEYDFKFDFDESEPEFSTKSFKDYLSARIASAVLTVRGGVPPEATTSTGEEDADELGPEVGMMPASKYYGMYVHSLKLRFRISIIMLLGLIYLSIGLPVTGALNNSLICTLVCLIIQFTVIVLSLDVFSNGILNIFRGKFGADSLASISCIITVLDGVMVITGNIYEHLPLFLISSTSLIGVLYSSLLSCRAMRKALRVPAISEKRTRYTVTGETGITGKEITLLKSRRKIEGFIRRVEEEPVDESAYRKISLIIVVLPIVITAVIAYLNKNYSDILYIYSIIFCCSVPVTSLLCYALPYYMASQRIFNSGAAIAGWSGATDIGHSKNLIVTDRDLFPYDSLSLVKVRIFADYDSDKVIAYACSMIKESQSCLAETFERLRDENNCKYLRVDNFECLSGGGFKGMIEGKTVLCGNSDLMRLMDVKIPSKLLDNTNVLLSIDGILYGIFTLEYKADSRVRKALVSLMKSNRHAIFAVRDFNITPEMIHDIFDVATDGYDFPPYPDRFPLSQARPSKESKIAGVICRDGLAPLIALADSGRSLFVIAKLNTSISVVTAFIGMIFSSIILFLGFSITLKWLFVFQIICTVPILLLGIFGQSFN